MTPAAILNTDEDIQDMLTLLARVLPAIWLEHCKSDASTTPKTIDNVETFLANPNTSLIQIEGVANKEDAQFCLGTLP